MTAYELQQRLKNYNLTTEIVKAIKETKQVMISMNQAQLMRGRNSINTKIQPKYKSKSYAKLKRKMNAKPGQGTPDINYTGSFQKKIDVVTKGKNYDFISKDSKEQILTTKYPFILGLTAKDTEKYSKDTLLPVLKQNLKNKLSK